MKTNGYRDKHPLQADINAEDRNRTNLLENSDFQRMQRINEQPFATTASDFRYAPGPRAREKYTRAPIARVKRTRSEEV
jgi:hypothetical protein